MNDDELAEETLRALTALGVSAYLDPDCPLVWVDIGEKCYGILCGVERDYKSSGLIGVQTVSQAIDAVEGWLAAEAPKPGPWERFVTWLTGW